MKKILVGLVFLGLVFSADFGRAEEEEVPTVMVGLYHVYITKDYGKAVEVMTGVIGLRPDEGSGYQLRGRAYFEMGEYEKAWEDVHRAQAAKEPGDVSALRASLKEATGRDN